jgi:2-polyprenyl-6-methoxyphenol hydroxylase-like FAD-dependent oxidoreductase
VVAPRYTKGHCVILGDAAFATMGIGTSLAMIGAYCIAGELSKIESASQVPDALQKYEDLVRPYIEKTQNPLGAGVGMQIANPQTRWGVWAFQMVLKIIVVLKVPQLLMRFFGGDEKEAWKLPEYGW